MFSPILKAVVGVVGVSIISTFLKALSKSALYKPAHFLGFPVIGIVISCGRGHKVPSIILLLTSAPKPSVREFLYISIREEEFI